MHRNHCEAQVSRIARKRDGERQRQRRMEKYAAFDAAVLAAVAAKCESSQKTYGVTHGPFGADAHWIGWRLKSKFPDIGWSFDGEGRKVAAALRRLRRQGLVGYDDWGKTWHIVRPRPTLRLVHSQPTG